MANKVRKVKNSPLNSNLLLAIAYIVMGILFCIKKGEVLNWVMIVAGVFYIVIGILDLVLYKNPTVGLIEIIIGAVILVFGLWILSVATIVLGVLIIIYSIINIFNAPQNFFTLLVNVLAIVVGVMLIINKWVVADWFFIILGIVLIVNGVLKLFEKK